MAMTPLRRQMIALASIVDAARTKALRLSQGKTSELPRSVRARIRTLLREALSEIHSILDALDSADKEDKT